ncbi:hypothetical protein KAX02_04440 [candidate division WOR-3 bacterium]|nr:hypothetical protein [candidate division WOR-3 bacterium]
MVKRLMKIGDLVAYLSMIKRRLYYYLRLGKIPHKRISNKEHRYDKKEIDNWLDNGVLTNLIQEKKTKKGECINIYQRIIFRYYPMRRNYELFK